MQLFENTFVRNEFLGGIGQPLSLLLKQSPLVTELSLYDIVHTPGVAADLSHIDTPAKVEAHNGAENLEKALKGEINALTLSPCNCHLNTFFFIIL